MPQDIQPENLHYKTTLDISVPEGTQITPGSEEGRKRKLAKLGLTGQSPEIIPKRIGIPEMVVDHEQTERVLGLLMNAYNNKLPPFDVLELPHVHENLPKTLVLGSKDHAMYYFNLCYYMRGGSETRDSVIRLSNMYDANPELFDCAIAAATSPADIEEVLKLHGFGLRDTASKHWHENAKRLLDHYDGDPRKIFDGDPDRSLNIVNDFDSSIERVKNDKKGGGFLGFKEKMTSMIIYYLMNDGLIHEFPFPPPIDFHFLRVSIANELVRFPNSAHGTDLYSEGDDGILATLRNLYSEYANQHSIDQLDLANAVWMLSESLCGLYPGNKTKEPFGKIGEDGQSKGRSVELYAIKVDVSDHLQIDAYNASCGICPLESVCKYSIAAGPYYRRGALAIRAAREKFPAPTTVVEPLF